MDVAFKGRRERILQVFEDKDEIMIRMQAGEVAYVGDKYHVSHTLGIFAQPSTSARGHYIVPTVQGVLALPRISVHHSLIAAAFTHHRQLNIEALEHPGQLLVYHWTESLCSRIHLFAAR